ncbi:MAG: hypothetical protein RIF32_01880 [Leptospirales bacterium]|jgi:hypothetical protein
MNLQTRNILRGAALGGGLALTVFGLWYYAAVSLDLPEPKGRNTPQSEATDELNIFFVIVPTLVGLLCGAALGWLAGKFQSSRYLKLLAGAAGLYFVAAWITGGALVIATAIQADRAEFIIGEILIETLRAGLLGALVLSPICGPLLFVLVFVLERLTAASSNRAAVGEDA